jgi:hypothetical protein
VEVVGAADAPGARRRTAETVAMIMPWGKFRGRDVRNVPTSYPAWTIETSHVRDARVRAAARELGRRFGDGGSERARATAASSRVPPALRSVTHEIVERGFRHRLESDIPIMVATIDA